jgi:hypothetical protein
VLYLLVHVWVGDSGPVHPDVVVITAIQELLPDELSVIVSDNGVGDLRVENHALDKAHSLLGANFGKGPRLNPLSEFIDHSQQVGQAPRCLLEGSQEIQAPHDK